MDEKHIVFVCVENSCRSQMAEAFAKKVAPKGWQVWSAGSNPSGQVNPKALASMRRIGYDLSKHKSQSITDLPNETYTFAVTMGCGENCSDLQAETKLDWGIPDPKHMEEEDFDDIRDMIEACVVDFFDVD